jgi:hypothetical protein
VGACSLESPPVEGGVSSRSQTPPLVKEDCSKENCCHGSRRDSKTTIIVLPMSSCNLTD